MVLLEASGEGGQNLLPPLSRSYKEALEAPLDVQRREKTDLLRSGGNLLSIVAQYREGDGGVWAEQKEVMVLKELHDMQGRLMEMSDKLNKLIRCNEGNLEGELGMGSSLGSCVEPLKGLGKGQMGGPEGKA